jgi:hypothetical protein
MADLAAGSDVEGDLGMEGVGSVRARHADMTPQAGTVNNCPEKPKKTGKSPSPAAGCFRLLGRDHCGMFRAARGGPPPPSAFLAPVLP